MENLKRKVHGKIALISIDIFKGDFSDEEQNYYYGDTGIDTMPSYKDNMQRAGKLILDAKAKGIPVVFIRECHRRNGVDFGRELDGMEREHLYEDSEDSMLPYEELNIDEKDFIVVKRRYSAFFKSDLELVLRGLGVETLILVGGLTDVCVHYTFVDGHQNNYYCKVVKDCVGGSSNKPHEASLVAMEYLQTGSVIDFEDARNILEEYSKNQ